MREIGILIELGRLKHPNIVRYVSFDRFSLVLNVVVDDDSYIRSSIHDIIHKGRSISIAFELIDCDLKAFMEKHRKRTGSKTTNSKNLPPVLVKVRDPFSVIASRFLVNF